MPPSSEEADSALLLTALAAGMASALGAAGAAYCVAEGGEARLAGWGAKAAPADLTAVAQAATACGWTGVIGAETLLERPETMRAAGICVQMQIKSMICRPMVTPDGARVGAVTLFFERVVKRLSPAGEKTAADLAQAFCHAVMAHRNAVRAKRQELWFEASADVADIAPWRLDLKTGWRSWSPRLYRFVGLPLNQPPPSWAEGDGIFHREDRRLVRQTVGTAISRRQPFDFMARLVPVAGVSRTVHVKGIPEFDDSGRMIAYVGVFANVTPLHRANEAVAEAHRLASMAEDIGGVGYWRHDPATQSGYWSPVLYKIYDLDPARGVPSLAMVQSMFHPEDAPLAISNLRRAIYQSEPFDMRVRIVRPGGEIRHIHAKGCTDTGDLAQACAIFGTVIDVTDTLKVAQALRDSEKRFRLLAENATDIIVEGDAKFHLTYVSPSVEKVLHRTPQSLLGANGALYIHPDDYERVMAAWQSHVETGGDGDILLKYRMLRPDGTVVWIEAHPKVIRDDAGVIVGYQDTLRDISQRVADESALQAANAEAAKANAAKAEFLANMSHELRTPLNSIIGFTEILERLRLEGEALVCVKHVNAAARSLLILINDLLDFSKLEAGRIELSPAPTSVERLCAEVVEMLSLEAEKKALTLSVRPLAPHLAYATFDPNRVRQILINFLSNAIKFTETGGATLSVALTQADSGPCLRFSVTDSGPGLTETARQKLFQRFSQADGSISRRYGGTGLGLAICREFANLMGGRIGVESALGAGSCFWFEIPFTPANESDIETDNAVVSPEIAVAPGRILIVDDHAANRELLRLLLSAMNVACDEADSGEDAVALSLRFAYDAILMDIQMPKMDGMTATRLIRQDSDLNRATPIIALTALSGEERLKQLYAAGVDDYLAKPISAQRLIETLAKHLGEAAETDDSFACLQA